MEIPSLKTELISSAVPQPVVFPLSLSSSSSSAERSEDAEKKTDSEITAESESGPEEEADQASDSAPKDTSKQPKLPSWFSKGRK